MFQYCIQSYSRMAGNKVFRFPALLPIRDISWCFKPLFYWIRVFGIELEPMENGYRKVHRIYSLALLLVCQWASFDISFLNRSILSPNKTSNTSSATYSWNVRIDHMNHFCLMAIVSPAFFYVAQGMWLRLWELINVLDATCRINHGQLRKFILIGFLPIGTEIGVIVYNLLVTLPNFPMQSPYRKFVTVVAMFAKIIPISAMVLFGSTAWMICLLYEEIQINVQRNCMKVNRKHLRSWKCSLSLISDVVDLIGTSFGLILLESITHFFIEFIARSFYLVNSISMTNLPETTAIVGMISRIFLLWIIVYSPSNMYHKARKVATALGKIESTDIALQNQVTLLALDTVRNLPKISPLGYFDVNLRLITKLTGTTLTYLIVLYQFQTSETNN